MDSTPISIPLHENSNISEPPLNYLLAYDGKFPEEVNLFQTDPLKSRLIRLLGKDNYDLLLSMELNLDIKVENEIVTIQGYEHKHYAFYYVGALDVNNDVITIGLVSKTGVHLLSENDKLIPKWINDWNEKIETKIIEQSDDLVLNKIGDEVHVGNFVYLVRNIEYVKTVENVFNKHKADGIYLIVYLAVLNKSRESRTLANAMFKVFDSDGYEFETSTNAIEILILNDHDKVFLFKEIPPKIPKEIIIPFEVPTSNDTYTLQVSGGFLTGETAKINLQN